MMNRVDLSKWARKGGRTRHSLCDLCCVGSAPCVSPFSATMDGLQSLRVSFRSTHSYEMTYSARAPLSHADTCLGELVHLVGVWHC